MGVILTALAVELILVGLTESGFRLDRWLAHEIRPGSLLFCPVAAICEIGHRYAGPTGLRFDWTHSAKSSYNAILSNSHQST
jgi:hypothetical protein